ncbi:MAG: hypothetical protein ABC505_03465 [Candidatus Methanosuratincola petrocarbonis]
MGSSLIHSREAQAILKALKEGKICEFRPEVAFSKGVYYPEACRIAGVSPSDSAEFMGRLYRAGVLETKRSENLFVCPSCGSHKFLAQMRCRSCGSMDIARTNMIEHLKCGYIDSEDAFRKSRDLVCPKCGKTLTAIGVDFRRHGPLYRCSSCGKFDQNPEKRFQCSEGHFSSEEEMEIRLIPTYHVAEGAQQIIERELINIQGLVDELRSQGIHAEAPAKLIGQSGVEHVFDLAAFRNGPGSAPYLTVSIFVSDRSLEAISVLTVMAKVIDIRPEFALLAAVPGIDESGRALARSYRIELVESETATDLVQRLRSAVFSLPSKGMQIKEVESHAY